MREVTNAKSANRFGQCADSLSMGVIYRFHLMWKKFSTTLGNGVGLSYAQSIASVPNVDFDIVDSRASERK